MYKIQTFYRTGQTSTLPCVTLEGSLFVHLRGVLVVLGFQCIAIILVYYLDIYWLKLVLR